MICCATATNGRGCVSRAVFSWSKRCTPSSGGWNVEVKDLIDGCEELENRGAGRILLSECVVVTCVSCCGYAGNISGIFGCSLTFRLSTSMLVPIIAMFSSEILMLSSSTILSIIGSNHVLLKLDVRSVLLE